jgi:hypothetical protein
VKLVGKVTTFIAVTTILILALILSPIGRVEIVVESVVTPDP